MGSDTSEKTGRTGTRSFDKVTVRKKKVAQLQNNEKIKNVPVQKACETMRFNSISFMTYEEIDKKYKVEPKGLDLKIGPPSGIFRINKLRCSYDFTDFDFGKYLKPNKSDEELPEQMLSLSIGSNGDKDVPALPNLCKVIEKLNKTKTRVNIQRCGKKNYKSEPEKNGTLYETLKWYLPCSIRWRNAEALSKKWSSEFSPATLDEVSEKLDVSINLLKTFEVLDLENIFNSLKSLQCFYSHKEICRAIGLSYYLRESMLQFPYFAESHGSYFKSELIDKRLTWLEREKEQKPTSEALLVNLESNCRSVIKRQVDMTKTFSVDLFTKPCMTFFSGLEGLEPNWTIIQISSLPSFTNRFGVSKFEKRECNDLMITCFSTCQSNKKLSFSSFATICRGIENSNPITSCRNILENFQDVLSSNLHICNGGDPKMSKTAYWRERSKQNQQIKFIIDVVEDVWLFPWSILFPGSIDCAAFKKKIAIEMAMLEKLTRKSLDASQILLIQKLMENYHYIEDPSKKLIEVIVSHHLKTTDTISALVADKIIKMNIEAQKYIERNPTVLIVDDETECLPLENMRCFGHTNVTRMPSLNSIHCLLNMTKQQRSTYPNLVDPDGCTFVLNPDNSLPSVQKRLETYLRSHDYWKGIVARYPTYAEMQETLEKSDIFLYCGHGSGATFFPDHAIQKTLCKSIALLMGCSSVQIPYRIPRSVPSSLAHSYLMAGCPSIVGNLWEVTDAECDRLTLDFLHRWLPSDCPLPEVACFDSKSERESIPSLSTCLRLSKKAATQTMTQYAIVCFGIPVQRKS